MEKRRFNRLRVGLTVLISLAIWSLLVWRHFHGGVPDHHPLIFPFGTNKSC